MTTTPQPFRVVYVGARIVGRHCLEALLTARAEIVGLIYLDDTLKDVTVAHESFTGLIAEYGLHARSFRTLGDPDLIHWMNALQPDVGAVVGVSQLIGESLLAVPRLGFIGMHPTLLPQGRGRAPIPWALIKGLEKTGVSLFWCGPGADTGPLLAQREVPIHYEDTAATLGARTDAVAADLLVESIAFLAKGHIVRMTQDAINATNWPRRRPEDGLIKWTWTRRRIYDWVRALTHPYPGAFTTANGKKLFVWSCRESEDQRRGEPGMVLDVLPHGVLVACAEGAVLLTLLQWGNDRVAAAADAGLVKGQWLG